MMKRFLCYNMDRYGPLKVTARSHFIPTKGPESTHRLFKFLSAKVTHTPIFLSITNSPPELGFSPFFAGSLSS